MTFYDVYSMSQEICKDIPLLLVGVSQHCDLSELHSLYLPIDSLPDLMVLL